MISFITEVPRYTLVLRSGNEATTEDGVSNLKLQMVNNVPWTKMSGGLGH